MSNESRESSDARRVGLVLTGSGGAKGAYQAGVVKCLAAHDVQISAIAGANVGALNGAIVAGASGLREGAARLDAVWRALARASQSELKVSADLPPLALGYYLTLLIASGEKSRIEGILRLLARVSRVAEQTLPPSFAKTRAVFAILNALQIQPEMATDAEFGNTVAQALAPSGFTGLPLYVSVFRSRGALLDLGWAAAGATGLTETPDSSFVHVQSLPPSSQLSAILASSAVPLLFEAQRIGADTYVDGGLGGRMRTQGVTPITPLLDEARCRVVIVTHATGNSLFNRHDFPDASVIEIRPDPSINRDGPLRDTLGFNPASIERWIEQGYADTERQLADVVKALAGLKNAATARALRDRALRRLDRPLDQH